MLQIRDLQRLNLELNQELEQVYASRSWRITAPLRYLAHRRFLRQQQMQARLQQQGYESRLQLVLGLGVQRLARVGWLRPLALRVLRRFPRVKHALQQLFAQVPFRQQLMLNNRDHSEDFEDRLPVSLAAVRLQALQHRDAVSIRKVLLDQMQAFCMVGHFDGSYSLAAVNRQLVLRLQQALPQLDVRLQPWEGQPKGQVSVSPGGAAEVATLNALLDEGGVSAEVAARRVQLFHHYPLIESVDASQGLPVVLFFWEESVVPAAMIATMNRCYRGVVVTAWFVKKALMDSGCVLPIQVVTLPLLMPAGAEAASFDDLGRAAVDKKVNFLHVSSCFPRKGVDVLLQAFELVAARAPEIHLTIKSFPNPHNAVESWIKTLVSPEFRDRIELIMEDYSAEQMAALYAAADVLVLPSRGEGLNLPAMEGGVFSRPVIVTGFGAHTDFAWHDKAWWIPFRFAPAQSHVSGGGSIWAEPSAKGLGDLLLGLNRQLLLQEQSVFDHASHFRNKVNACFYGPESSYAFLTGLSYVQKFALRETQRYERFSLSMVTTWGEACGIAEYSRHLLRELCHLGVEVQVAMPQDRLRQPQPEDAQLTLHEAWLHGQEPDLRWAGLTGDVVWLQHHFAFYSLNRRLLAGVRYLREQGKRVYITLHTTRPLLGFERGRMESAAACLSEFDRVFVHTLDDLNTLKRLGVFDQVSLMLHGIEQPAADAVAATAAEAAELPPVVGSFGFLLPHKGVGKLIEAFAEAKKQGWVPANCRLRLVTAVREDSASPHELARCKKLARELGVEADVEWFTDFLPLEEAHRLLAECRLLVLPYQFTLESFSGAVCTAMAACPHVATTPAPIFDDVRSIALQVDGYDVEPIAALLRDYFGGEMKAVLQRIEADRVQWMHDRSWPVLAAQCKQRFQSALVDRDFMLSLPGASS